MAWRRPGDKPLSELMMLSLPVSHPCPSVQDVDSITSDKSMDFFLRIALNIAQEGLASRRRAESIKSYVQFL